MATKNRERANSNIEINYFDKHRFIEFRPVDVSWEGGGGSLRETSMGRFWLQNRFVSFPLINIIQTKGMYILTLILASCP